MPGSSDVLRRSGRYLCHTTTAVRSAALLVMRFPLTLHYHCSTPLRSSFSPLPFLYRAAWTTMGRTWRPTDTSHAATCLRPASSRGCRQVACPSLRPALLRAHVSTLKTHTIAAAFLLRLP